MSEATEPAPHRSADVQPPSSAWLSEKNNRRRQQRSRPFAQQEACRSWSFRIRLRPSPPQSFPLPELPTKADKRADASTSAPRITLTLDSRRSSAGKSPHLIDRRHGRIAREPRHQRTMSPSQL